MPPVRWQSGAVSSVRPGLQPGELSTQAGLAQGNQRLVITQPSGEVDQDGVPELNFRDAMGCLGGSDQALQSDALGISLVSRPKRYEVSSLLVDMGNPN